MAGLLNSLQGLLGNVASGFQNILDRILPPEKRAEIFANLQSFAVNNPKLAAFLLTQIAFSGIPIALFITFTIAVFIFSLIAALLIGIVVALLFTVVMVLVALFVVLPTVFMTSFAAAFVFLWGLGGYHILKWLNEGNSPAPEGTAIGDKLNNLTGGRISWLMDGARKKHEGDGGVKEGAKKETGQQEEDSKESKGENGSAPDMQKHANTGKDQATKHVNSAPKKLNKTTNGATGGVTNTAAGAKGAVGGATG
jgi:hypothetical protein